MLPVISGLAMAYCVCTMPTPLERYPLIPVRPFDAGAFYESEDWGSSGLWGKDSRNSGLDRTFVSSSWHGYGVSQRLWEAPRLQFFHWPSLPAPDDALGSTDLANVSSEYSLAIDGCACAQPTELQSKLTLGTILPPALVTPTEEGEVPPQLTVMDGERAARELKYAWIRVIRKMPTDDTILILAAHWAHETSGGRFMYNYNYGGIRGRGSSGLSCLREAHEGWGWTAVASVGRFRAYRSASEGADDYVSLLDRRYPLAIAAARSGDILQFVKALRQAKYFTGSEAAYAQSLVELAERGHRGGYNALRMGAKPEKQLTSMNSRTALR
jgi:hypothetical protein